jgi:hypothetical protein
MTITRYPPNTIWLGGPRTEIGDIAAKEAITPGHAVERVNTAGVWQWQLASSVTAGSPNCQGVATEQSMLNKGVDDAYAAGDLMEVTVPAPGTNMWMFIASGQNAAYGDRLTVIAGGTLAVTTNDAQHAFTALETKANVTALTRIRVEKV